ncbi:MAG: 4-hydroxybutyrate CoA transferase [Chloroflexota bacterium]|nr:MAG: 4-hydroxybutyrate CoA transferase [Chloroflexota bacterium]
MLSQRSQENLKLEPAGRDGKKARESNRMDWREEYQRKLVSPEDAANLVDSRDYVVIATREPLTTSLALSARKEELSGVRISLFAPGFDTGWYDEGWEKSFSINIVAPTPICQEMADRRDCDTLVLTFTTEQVNEVEGDYKFFVEVSPPDERGFCSFGHALWDKKTRARHAQLVVAEVNEKLIRTYGENYIHVSEIDYFVEQGGFSSERDWGTSSLTGKPPRAPEPYYAAMVENVSKLVRDGSTIQIGVGRTVENFVRMGMLDNKLDLGYHSEATAPGIITLVKEGVITGKHKDINRGTAVATSLGGGTREEMEWVNENPLFHLMDVAYCDDPKVIAAHDNFTAINNILAIDLTGQITAESIGSRFIAAGGGQLAFACGAWLSRGGAYIAVLPSTAKTPQGTISRIMPTLLQGTLVSVPRNITDWVVTEYGAVRLKGKSVKRRVDELISIAHPDFRAELRKEAQKLYL